MRFFEKVQKSLFIRKNALKPNSCQTIYYLCLGTYHSIPPANKSDFNGAVEQMACNHSLLYHAHHFHFLFWLRNNKNYTWRTWFMGLLTGNLTSLCIANCSIYVEEC